MSNEFSTYLKECGIIPQLTPPGTPQWNDVSERRNRTLLDMVRSMMCQTELPLYFWGYALQIAARTLNIVPSKSVERTPHELWMGSPPSLTYLKIWDCEAYVNRMKTTKLQPKADKCFFIGYPKETKGYSFWHKLTNTIVVKKGAAFLEKEFLERIKSNDSRVILEEIQEDLQSDHETNDDPLMSYRPPVVSGSRASRVEETPTTPPPVVQATQVEDESIQQEIVEEVQTQEELQEHGVVRRSAMERRRLDFYMGLHEILVVDTEDPLTYEEAIQRNDSKAWQEAMESEIQSMYDNKVWTLVDLPNEKRPIQCQWIFKRKMDLNGNMTTYKARLVAKGFSQIHGIAYDETFSQVACLSQFGLCLLLLHFMIMKYGKWMSKPPSLMES